MFPLIWLFLLCYDQFSVLSVLLNKRKYFSRIYIYKCLHSFHKNPNQEKSYYKMKSVMNLRSLPSLMRGWQLESLSGIGAMNFREDLNVPILSTPNDVLVKVEASSVNPLDVMMTKGYGNSVLSNLRSDNIGKYIFTIRYPSKALI